MSEKLYLGIDGGGSITTAAVCSGCGEIIAVSQGSGINWYSLGIERAKNNLAEVVKKVCAEAHTEHFDGAFIGMSALAGEATDEELKNLTDGVICADKIGMNSDVYIALRAVGSDNCGVIISGTGSMAACFSGGKMYALGGWGYILGDEGSGYAIGMDGIKAVIASFESRAEQTALTKECLEHFEIGSVEELIPLFYEKGVERSRVASFGGRVCDIAEDGDELAAKILLRQAELIAETAAKCFEKISFDSPVGLWGGISRHSPSFAGFLKEALSEYGYNNVFVMTAPAYRGALDAAKEL